MIYLAIHSIWFWTFIIIIVLFILWLCLLYFIFRTLPHKRTQDTSKSFALLDIPQTHLQMWRQDQTWSSRPMSDNRFTTKPKLYLDLGILRLSETPKSEVLEVLKVLTWQVSLQQRQVCHFYRDLARWLVWTNLVSVECTWLCWRENDRLMMDFMKSLY